jgi:hypothetical protein
MRCEKCGNEDLLGAVVFPDPALEWMEQGVAGAVGPHGVYICGRCEGDAYPVARLWLQRGGMAPAEREHCFGALERAYKAAA